MRPTMSIIEVEACGICGTDLQILNVPPGHPADAGVVMGHEFIGHITGLGEGARASGLAIGQRVAVDPDATCGFCRYCRAGRPANCENVRALGIFRNGALARFAKAPARAVFPFGDGAAVRGGGPHRAPGLRRQWRQPGEPAAG